MGHPFGLVLEQTHGGDGIIGIDGEAVIDAAEAEKVNSAMRMRMIGAFS